MINRGRTVFNSYTKKVMAGLPSENNDSWKLEAERRVSELKSNKVKPIEGLQVFNEIQEKYLNYYFCTKYFNLNNNLIMNTNSQLTDDIAMLPIEDKLALVDDLLRTINNLPNENSDSWKLEAERRVSDLKSGKYKPIEGQQVFNEIQEKYSK